MKIQQRKFGNENKKICYFVASFQDADEIKKKL